MSISITPLCNDRKNIIVAMLFTRIVAWTLSRGGWYGNEEVG